MDKPVSPETLALLGRVSTNTLTGLMIKLAGLRTRAVQGVRPLVPSRSRFVGPAFTARYVPIREDLTDRASMASPNSHLHGTYDRIPRGSVLVMDMMRNDSCGCLGDVLVAGLIARGVAGLVCDGGVRDGEAIAGMTLPVFSSGVAAPPSNRALLAADIQVRIGCGGVLVEAGDIVVGDPDGVVIVPRHMADELARKGVEQEDVEAWVRKRVENGEPVTGLYPPGEKTLAEYREWVAAGRR
jgi:regulator of RNase E activity RraA